MLSIHQPYIKKEKIKRFLALVSIGAFLLGSLVISNAFSETSKVQAAEIKYMQQFTNPICQSMGVGDTMDLIDPRGESKEDFQTYRVIKMLDNTCWMAENLRLPAETEITPEDSDVISSYTLPPDALDDTTVAWSGATNVAFMVNGRNNILNNDSSDLGAWKEAYGNYYSWCAATAMSCMIDRTGNAIINSNAAESICPKNWELPTNYGARSLQALYDIYPNKFDSVYWLSNQAVPYNGTLSSGYTGRRFGINSRDALFLASGLVDSNGLGNSNQYGYYWSRTGSGPLVAYYLGFSLDDVTSQNVISRHYGFSVRCVADSTVTTSDFTYEGDIYWEESKDGNVTVTMPSVLTIDAVSEFVGAMDASNLLEGSISATIFSNTAYDVLMNADADAALISADGNRIEPVSPTNEVKAGNNAWGFWDGSTEPKLYTVPLSTSMKAIPDVESSGENNATVHTYYLGISIAPSLPSGVYATNVTVTAAVK